MRLLALLLATATLASSTTATATTPIDDPLISKFPSLVSWFRTNGGTIDNRIQIGYDSKGIRGTIATENIPAGTRLIHTPSTLIITTDSGNRYDQCGQIAKVVQELNHGVHSKWHEYFTFDDSRGSRIPSQWDDREHEEGRTGRAMMELQGLPPSGETHRHVDWYRRSCLKIQPNNGRDDEEADDGDKMGEVEWRALLMVMTRAADLGMIPMYDLMNHHNGLINTRLEVDSEGGLSVIALTNIPANAPIYNTYARSGWESSVDVFNTYGFVEDYPQLWRWSDDALDQLTLEDRDHARRRYGIITGDNGEPKVKEPNSHHYEVLVISPTLAALAPTKQLVEPLGNYQLSMEEWEEAITDHHASLFSSHANALHDSAVAVLNSLPTSIEEDTAMIPVEKQRLEKVKKVGRFDTFKADAIQAIEFRLVFKKALKLAAEVAEREQFFNDSEEL